MAPAWKCEGCGHTARTPEEPANPVQMAQLFTRWGIHCMTNLARGLNPKETGFHETNITFYETTPATGFEDAEVVGVTGQEG